MLAQLLVVPDVLTHTNSVDTELRSKPSVPATAVTPDVFGSPLNDDMAGMPLIAS